MIETNKEIGKIKVLRWDDARRTNDKAGKQPNRQYLPKGAWKHGTKINYTKYNIKESDFRIKTATFTSPNYIDLTEGLTAVLISSQYHENFAGIILDVDYDKDTELYSYQCQDFSRLYMGKMVIISTGWQNVYNHLVSLLTMFNIDKLYKSIPKSYDNKTKGYFKEELSGLRPYGRYNQSLYPNQHYKGNPFAQKPKMIVRDKTYIEVIRDLVFNSLGFFDVYFNSLGVVQIEPLSKTDWEKTGLHLTTPNALKSKYKFSTTNAITRVMVNGSGFKSGEIFGLWDLGGTNQQLDLTAFFGNVGASISDPVQKTTTSASKNTSNATKTNAKSTAATNKYGNPFKNKPKKVWINADNGSNSMKNSLINLLKKNGWTVHDGGTWSNAHIQDVFKVTKDYSVYITLYNGFCAGTMREAYSSYVQNPLKKVNVQLVPIWDTSDWTNPNGMKPYRYGDFSGYNAKRAWDDNFSSGDPSIKSVGDWLKKNKATYCAAPTAKEIMQQFNAGGYFKYKGIQ